jgi:peptidoglycan hydrolase CwlO-like protein
MGLVAEEVADVEPLLVIHNDKGEIEGVKYDRVGVVLINAVKEQQAQIEDQRTLIESQQKSLETQQRQIEQQQRQVDALKRLVCSMNGSADICRKEQ